MVGMLDDLTLPGASSLPADSLFDPGLEELRRKAEEEGAYRGVRPLKRPVEAFGAGAAPIGMLGDLTGGGVGPLPSGFTPMAGAPGMLNQPAPPPTAPAAPEQPFGAGARPDPYLTAAALTAPSKPATPPSPAPAQAALPANSTPTSGAAPPGAAPNVPETSLFGRLGDIAKGIPGKINDNSGMLMGLASGLAGAPSFGTGMSRAFGAAIPGMASDTQLQKQNQTVAALVKRGVPQDVALSAAGNPAIMSQILPQIFGSKQRQFTQVGEDAMGNKKFGFVDPVSNKVFDLTGNEISGHGGGAGDAIPMGPDGAPLKGDALLAHFEKNDPVTAAGIKGLISGDLNAQGRNLQKLAPLASLVDPTFDAAQYPVRLATRKSYTSGKDFQETQALNTVSGHMGKLMDSADALGNSDWKPINKVKNWYADTFTGSPELTRFRNDLVTTQNELAKAYHGGHVSDSAFAAFNKSINEAQTPAELKASIGELAGLLQSKIEAKESGYRASMGGAVPPSEFHALNDEAAHSFQKIGDWSRGIKPVAATAASPASAAPSAPTGLPAFTPKPGATYRFDPATGHMVEAK